MISSILLGASLVLRVYPAMGLVDPGTSSKEVLFTLEIKLKRGEAVPEDWVCPELEWTWFPADAGNKSTEESDCTLEEREHPPTFWSRRRRVPGGEYETVVRLRRAGRIVGSASVTVRLGGM